MTATAKIPALTDHAGYKAEADKLESLRQQLTDLDAEIGRLTPLARTTTTLDAKARNLISGNSDSDVVAVARQKYEEATGKRRVLYRAVELQKEALQKVEGEARAELAKPLVPEYRERVGKIIASLAVVAQDIADLEDWLYKLSSADVRHLGLLPPVIPIGLLGYPANWENGRLNHLVREACENGLIDYSHPAAVACNITPPRPPAPVAAPTPRRPAPDSARQRAALADDGTDDMAAYRKLRGGRRRAPEPVASAAATAAAERAADAAADTY